MPLEDLERFGYDEQELGDGVVDERFVELMRFEIRRTRRLYALADDGMDYIPRGRRFPVVVARELYAGILDRIEAQGYDVFARRAETSRPASSGSPPGAPPGTRGDPARRPSRPPGKHCIGAPFVM